MQEGLFCGNFRLCAGNYGERGGQFYEPYGCPLQHWRLLFLWILLETELLPVKVVLPDAQIHGLGY
jgi:hypothetical protein